MTRKLPDGTVMLDDLPARARQMKAANEARKDAQLEALEAEQQKHTGKVCMFKVRNLNTECLKNCALYEGNGCVLGGAEARETEGKYCALIGKKCGDTCALYSKTGCTIRPVRS